ncbi:MAG: histidinol-phosphate transaminase [Bacteroidetes bacterium]|nr:histidinol-phosphate transaminase [Bacteroidota bacterium]
MFDINQLIRDNIRSLVSYSSARDEFHGEARVFLDANENSLGSPLMKWYNRYPDPHQSALKERLSAIKGIDSSHIFLGNGSDEAIDILYRAFCTPGEHNVIVCPPTYGMYEVSAAINDITVRKAPLHAAFGIDLDALESAVDEQTRMIWLCSPNNPTGNSLQVTEIETILNNFHGLVVVDEAYINFSRHRSLLPALTEYPNLVVLQTLSKAWGLASLRIGMAFASAAIIDVMNRIKPPYNINGASQELALQALEEVGQVNDMIRIIVSERERLADVLSAHPAVIHVYPSDANFLLAKVQQHRALYQHLLDHGIVVRDRSTQHGCAGCLRITVGTPAENALLMQALDAWMESQA